MRCPHHKDIAVTLSYNWVRWHAADSSQCVCWQAPRVVESSDSRFPMHDLWWVACLRHTRYRWGLALAEMRNYKKTKKKQQWMAENKNRAYQHVTSVTIRFLLKKCWKNAEKLCGKTKLPCQRPPQKPNPPGKLKNQKSHFVHLEQNMCLHFSKSYLRSSMQVLLLWNSR